MDERRRKEGKAGPGENRWVPWSGGRGTGVRREDPSLCSPRFRVEGCPWLPAQPSPLPSPIPVLQIGSYYGSEITSVDIDGDGVTDVLLVGAPMYFSEGRERGRVYVYNLRQVLLRWGALRPCLRSGVREESGATAERPVPAR